MTITELINKWLREIEGQKALAKRAVNALKVIQLNRLANALKDLRDQIH